MNLEEIKRACQLAMDGAGAGTPRRFAHAEVLTILQRPGITAFEANDLLMVQRAAYLGYSRATDVPADDGVYWWEVYCTMQLIGTWVRGAVNEDR